MFHTIITLAYILPNIYVFIRIWQVFINKKKYRITYTLIYLGLALIYPVSGLFLEGENGIVAAIFTTLSNYLLPYYLYLFLTVLCFDILLLINYISKAVPFQKFKEKRFKNISLAIVIIVPLIVVTAGAINFNTIRTSEYFIELPGKSSRLKHLKIAFAADFHLKERTNTGFVRRFVKRISDIKPDLMLFGGDIVEGDREDKNMMLFEDLLREIKVRYGVYTVLGNHEYYGGEDKGDFFHKAGINVLCDTVLTIDSSFFLAGRLDSHSRYRKSVDGLLSHIPDSLPLILVDHRPTEIDKVSRTIADVQLSGHTHNGQMFPINLITGRVYELSWGHRKIGNTHFFVTSGIRLWGPPVRTTGKSEIMVINISFTENPH